MYDEMYFEYSVEITVFRVHIQLFVQFAVPILINFALNMVQMAPIKMFKKNPIQLESFKQIHDNERKMSPLLLFVIFCSSAH